MSNLCCWQQETFLGLHVKCWIFLSQFEPNVYFLNRIQSLPPVSSFMKIHPLGAELIHVVRWTYMMKLIGAFHLVCGPCRVLEVYKLSVMRTGCSSVKYRVLQWSGHF